jgi:hypothetical protein
MFHRHVYQRTAFDSEYIMSYTPYVRVMLISDHTDEEVILHVSGL